MGLTTYANTDQSCWSLLTSSQIGTILGKERKLPPSGAVFSLAARSACQLFFWGE
jgi:hypothetical protein